MAAAFTLARPWKGMSPERRHRWMREREPCWACGARMIYVPGTGVIVNHEPYCEYINDKFTDLEDDEYTQPL